MTDQQAISGKILILDADTQRAAEFSRCLRYLNYEPVIADPEQSRQQLNSLDSLAIVAGDIETDGKLAEAACEFHAAHQDVPFICFPEATGSRPELADGHSWPLEMPLRRSQLVRLLQRAERYQGQERRQRLTGSSSSIRGVRKLIEQVADFDTNVLITGQSGTGKELVARTIHELSDRADKPFVPINCGAIPAELLESELFGHEKGAFTGAIANRTGRFELAEGGTLFLDEIGDMSIDMQVKLLRVLQERTFERVGSGKTQKCDVRIVAATHRDLPTAVKEGDFREDLYYRLNVFPIEMPPLFKRVSDLPQLMRELFVSHSAENKDELRVSPAAVRILARYPWPGNIRELSNLVERLAIIKPEGTIDVDDLPAKYRETQSEPIPEMNNVVEAMQLTEANLKERLQNVEQDLIGQAMTISDGVVAKAARLLSMRRTTLVEKIGKYNIVH
ncbi:MAG: sigma-54-dependent Fis family transcriptional regulator [Gammaproteobacteria bacterium]|nr:sigma-54-dependent Fis family transcriptional regulator [Gammaproteobacteria bacterium]